MINWKIRGEGYVMRMSLYAPPPSTSAFYFSSPIYPPTFSLNLQQAICFAKSCTDRTCRTWSSRTTAAAAYTLQRTSPLERASSWLPAPLRLHTSGVYKNSTRTSKTSAVQYSPAVQFQPDTRELSFFHTESPLVV